MAEGKSSKEIASHLNLSVKTVDTHRTNVLRKLNLHSVSELVMFAVKNKMVQVTVFPVETAPPTWKLLQSPLPSPTLLSDLRQFERGLWLLSSAEARFRWCLGKLPRML
jgi:hypothetical protein